MMRRRAPDLASALMMIRQRNALCRRSLAPGKQRAEKHALYAFAAQGLPVDEFRTLTGGLSEISRGRLGARRGQGGGGASSSDPSDPEARGLLARLPATRSLGGGDSRCEM